VINGFSIELYIVGWCFSSPQKFKDSQENADTNQQDDAMMVDIFI